MLNKKNLYLLLMVLCGIYHFIPEPTDLIPIFGWLDEATVLGFIFYLNKKYKEEKRNSIQNLKV